MMGNNWSQQPVKDSPVGPGKIYGFSHAGYPQVNCVAVAWCEMEDGTIFDPDGVRDEHIARRARKEKGNQ